jgi:hypothetical protein
MYCFGQKIMVLILCVPRSRRWNALKQTQRRRPSRVVVLLVLQRRLLGRATRGRARVGVERCLMCVGDGDVPPP